MVWLHGNSVFPPSFCETNTQAHTQAVKRRAVPQLMPQQFASVQYKRIETETSAKPAGFMTMSRKSPKIEAYRWAVRKNVSSVTVWWVTVIR